MRELKFRIWDNKNKKFLPESHFAILGSGKVIVTLSGYYEHFTNKTQDDYVVQQYTGLKDKNDKGVYEGDIVKTIYVNDPVNDIGNIIYHVETGAYRIKTSKNLLPIVTYRFIEDKPQGLLQVADEIIGNIFENPELLK